MEWQDEGVLLRIRSHGETDAVASAFTFANGRHAGLVKGGAGRKASTVLQPGNRVQLVWKARLSDQLGHYTVEPMRLFANRLVGDPVRLAALGSATTLVEMSLAERDPHPVLYAAMLKLLGDLADDAGWPETYVRFELVLLHELGFGLGLESCAVTGVTTDLVFVSPRTGRAVSREAAGDLAGRLLPLPSFLRGEGQADLEAIRAGLQLTGHFLQKHVTGPMDQPLPATRERLAQLLAPKVETSIS
ncbi:MAG: DNA repair protein RecO [Geminicoccaceae bacterium]